MGLNLRLDGSWRCPGREWTQKSHKVPHIAMSSVRPRMIVVIVRIAGNGAMHTNNVPLESHSFATRRSFALTDAWDWTPYPIRARLAID
jgi:hypothetical protein